MHIPFPLRLLYIDKYILLLLLVVLCSA